MAAEVRSRRVGPAQASGGPRDHHPLSQATESGRQKQESAVQVQPGTFWLTRIVLLRSIAFIYFVAFSVAYQQNKQLLGEKGLLPGKLYLQKIQQYTGGRIGIKAISYAPTILWFLDWSDMDVHLDTIALLGMGLSVFILIAGCANMIIMFVLWILYHSLVNIGQIWYSFGWESQLLETGFLSIFLCPVLTLRTIPHHTPSSKIVIWSFRWLIFRIMLGATQPVPNPIAYYMHRSPLWFHSFEVLTNHFIELIVPFFLFLGRRMCVIHGILQILFQVLLIISGNLSFLNWLTIVPSIACFDDSNLAFFFSSRQGGVKDQVSKIQAKEAAGHKPPTHYGVVIRQVLNASFGVLIAYLSLPVIINLLSSKQMMNTSFNPLRIVNTYGAFGSITKERTEVIIQGTMSQDPNDPSALWEEYEFKCKPGDLKRRPCIITPYHYRLDWLMWFAAFQTYEQNEWLIHLAGRLLMNDSLVLSLIAHNPFQNQGAPRWVRGEHYRYKFSQPNGNHAADGKWWIRKRIGPYFPPVNLKGLKNYFKERDWPIQ
ncbi:lipase maturation factor 1 isoform X2 [Chiloscyllium plagiosum]|uniref:lipase maturation factor 1 isoform X2 n=1 Tax=Chiloscyllium plagiosum TaxID=36176 RepID=UPI001CB858C3|nr:lipase maturation factor 1 isoform X2 [Chiloscyllium plagiosum]